MVGDEFVEGSHLEGEVIEAQFDLTLVELPAYSDECYADVAAIDCAFPKDELLKIFNADLAEKDADVHTFPSNMNYGSEAQIAMLADGIAVEEAVQAWVDANEDVWSSWLPYSRSLVEHS